MSVSKKPRSECAKDSASDVRAVIQFELLTDDASHEQREVYIKKHAVAVKGAGRKELKHSWCIGREIPKIKAEKDLNNNEADAYFKATFGFDVRQGNNYEHLWQAFPSIEEMLKNVPESASLSVAVDKARAVIDPDRGPALDCPPDDVSNGGQNTGTPTESGRNGGIGKKPPPNGIARSSSDFSYSKFDTSNGMSGKTNAWRNLPRVIAEVGDWLQRAIIENLHWKEVIKRYDSKETLFYLHPPYLPETRNTNSRQGCKHEMSCSDHIRLLDALQEVQGMVILSGYDSDLYDQILSGWVRIEFDTTTRAGNAKADGKLSKRKEVLWMNFTPAVGVAAWRDADWS